MLSYFSRCRKNTESKDPKIAKTKNERKCAVCDSKKSKFFKEQEARRLLSSLGIRAPLSQIPLLGPLLF